MKLTTFVTLEKALTAQQWLNIREQACKITPISIIELDKDMRTIRVQFWTDVEMESPEFKFSKEANEKAKTLLKAVIEKELAKYEN